MLARSRVYSCLTAIVLLVPARAHAQIFVETAPVQTATPSVQQEAAEKSASNVHPPVATAPPDKSAEPSEAAPQSAKAPDPAPLGAAVPIAPEERKPTSPTDKPDAAPSTHNQRGKVQAAASNGSGATRAEEVEEIYTEPRSPWRATDAHVDHVLLMPTAETHPQGTIYFSNYELVFVQFGYAITDRIQASLTTWVVPIFDDQGFFVDLSAKGNFYRSESISAAGWAGLTIFEGGTVFRAGVVGSVCFDQACRFSIHPSAMAVTGSEEAFNNDTWLGLTAIGFQGRLTSSFSLLLEAQFLTEFERGDPDFLESSVNFGVRYAKRSFAVDGGFVRPFELSPFPIGFPWVGFTYRAL